MAAVYRARDARGREVALKLLPKSSTDKDELRFEREGLLTSSLDHPGIVRVLAAGEHEGSRYLAFELVEGTNLEDRFESLSRDELLRVVLQVARAVGHAHGHGIVHRDLKPANILLDSRGRPRVADFGVARADHLARLTVTGALVGTPRIMAPEQLVADPKRLGPPLDVWALGVLLYRALTRRELFAECSSLQELTRAVANQEILPPRRIAPDLAPALEAVCLRALSRDELLRYPDGKAFAEALEGALRASSPSSLAEDARLAPTKADLPVTSSRAEGPPPPDPGPPKESDPADLTSEPRPTIADRYQILGPIGKGGAGTVFRVLDTRLGRPAALKLLDPSHEHDATRFLQEIRILASLAIPGVIVIHDTGIHEGSPYYVMEEATGGTLADAELDLRDWIRALAKVARTCGVIHARGIVHRDLKPENVLLIGGEPKLADFGVAKRLAPSPSEERGGAQTQHQIPSVGGLTAAVGLTREGALVGTPRYMSPEQLGEGQVCPATDVHAMGVMLFERACGEEPFQATRGLHVLCAALLDEHRPSPLEHAPDLPPVLARIIERAIARRPEERYPNGDALAEALEAWLEAVPLWRDPRVLVAASCLILLLGLGVASLSRPQHDLGQLPDTPPASPSPSASSSDKSSGGEGPTSTPRGVVVDPLPSPSSPPEKEGGSAPTERPASTPAEPRPSATPQAERERAALSPSPTALPSPGVSAAHPSPSAEPAESPTPTAQPPKKVDQRSCLYDSAIEGTDFDFVASKDPSVFRSLKYSGRQEQELPDRSRPQAPLRGTAYSFLASFEDTKLEISVAATAGNKSAARREALRLISPIGKLPRPLRLGLQRVVVHGGGAETKPFTAQGLIVVYAANVAKLRASGDLEEAIFQAAVHAVWDATHANSKGWLEAQAVDGKFLTRRGMEHPLREDLAESALFAFALLRHPKRIPAKDAAAISKEIPRRLAYVQALLRSKAPAAGPGPQQAAAGSDPFDPATFPRKCRIRRLDLTTAAGLRDSLSNALVLGLGKEEAQVRSFIDRTFAEENDLQRMTREELLDLAAREFDTPQQALNESVISYLHCNCKHR